MKAEAKGNKPEPTIEEIEITIEKLNSLSDDVLIKPVEIKQVGGLVNPKQYDDKPEFGRVVKVGPMVNPEIKVGDIVLFGKWASVQLSVGGEDYLVLKSDDIKFVCK